jgi:threonine dehydrogenase-like Zn-dependent dehydrogenase
MAYLVELTEPRSVGIRAYDDPAPVGRSGPDLVLRISAGTELATYRGTNPYLDRRWDPDMGPVPVRGTTFSYPLDVWGYSEVGRVEAVGPDVTSPRVGDVVWGMWGHRSHAVLPAERLEGHKLPAGLDPMSAPSTGSARSP